MSALSKFLLAGVLAAVPVAFSADLSADDQSFIDEAARAGMKEVHMGHLALEKGMSQAVKGFAQRLVNDHTKANQQLSALAKKKGAQMPADVADAVTSMPIAKKTGAEFDHDFAVEMIEGHQKVIDAFEKEAMSGRDPDLKKWAADTLPTLRGHLKEAQALPHS